MSPQTLRPSSSDLARVHHLRESFVEANERLVARLRRVSDEAAEREADGAWSAAQIGWHVAAVTTRFTSLIAGDIEVAAAVPERATAPTAVTPPPGVRRADAVAALEASGTRMARAFDALTPDRGGRMGVTHAIVGTITVYQIAEWATAHVVRHNRQAKRVLGEG